MQVLGNVCENRENGFNFLRLLAATGILVAHCVLAIPVMNGTLETVYAQFALAADLLLAVFFVFSGFLITASLERSQNLWRFATARILRIFPALIVVSLVLVFVLGPSITSLSMGTYLTSIETWLYLPRAVVLLDASAGLPGVFEQNPVAGAVNLPIWTLRYEVVIYALFPILALIFIKRDVRIRGLVLLFGLVVLLGFKTWLHSQSETGGLMHLANFSTSFIIGSALWTFRGHVPHSLAVVSLLWVMFVFISNPVMTYFVGVLAAGYTFVWLAFLNVAALKAYSKRPDYSYGTYVIHFPVAQFLYGMDPTLHPFTLTVLTLSLTLPLAALSWAFVEGPALASVKPVSAKIQSVCQDWFGITKLASLGEA